MTISEYLASAKQRLLAEPAVISFTVLRERVTPADGHWRVKMSLSDSSVVEFSEYMRVVFSDQIVAHTYSYHWSYADGRLICRWDNTPHFPGLPNFPHHIHEGADENVRPGQPTDMFAVLDAIVGRLSLQSQEN